MWRHDPHDMRYLRQNHDLLENGIERFPGFNVRELCFFGKLLDSQSLLAGTTDDYHASPDRGQIGIALERNRLPCWSQNYFSANGRLDRKNTLDLTFCLARVPAMKLNADTTVVITKIDIVFVLIPILSSNPGQHLAYPRNRDRLGRLYLRRYFPHT